VEVWLELVNNLIMFHLIKIFPVAMPCGVPLRRPRALQSLAKDWGSVAGAIFASMLSDTLCVPKATSIIPR
jgi:hypothetical protein